MNILIERGANVNVSYVDKRRPLHGASLSGDLNKVKFLLEKGAIIEVKDENNRTPLYSAVYGIRNISFEKKSSAETNQQVAQRLEIVKLLLKEKHKLTVLEYGQLLELIQDLRKTSIEDVVDFADEVYFLLKRYKP